jgi:hypothetical protein
MKLIRYYAIVAEPVFDEESGWHLGEYDKFTDVDDCDVNFGRLVDGLDIYSGTATSRHATTHKLWEVEINGRRTYLFDFMRDEVRADTLEGMQAVHYRDPLTYADGTAFTSAREMWVFVDGAWYVVCDANCSERVGSI